jgi:ATP-dependent DNA helicase RecQ
MISDRSIVKFRDIIDHINPKLNIVALTATATPKVQDDIQKNLGLKKPNVFVSSFNRSNLYYEIVPKGKKDQTVKHIVKFIQQNRGKSGIIYTLNRKTTEDLAELLVANGISAVAYHAGLDSKTRADRQDQFLDGKSRCDCCNHCLWNGYRQTGYSFCDALQYTQIYRKLLSGNRVVPVEMVWKENVYCIFHTKMYKNSNILCAISHLPSVKWAAQLISETVAYAESAICRRKVLLHYFGEEYNADSCNDMCDNCLTSKRED